MHGHHHHHHCPPPHHHHHPPYHHHHHHHGCYVATCVYGSYDCPQVWVLRRYRDNVLDESVLGRMFIRLYYAVSPFCVRTLGRLQFVRKGWQCILDRIVGNLKKKGFSELPYEDKPF